MSVVVTMVLGLISVHVVSVAVSGSSVVLRSRLGEWGCRVGAPVVGRIVGVSVVFDVASASLSVASVGAGAAVVSVALGSASYKTPLLFVLFA